MAASIAAASVGWFSGMYTPTSWSGGYSRGCFIPHMEMRKAGAELVVPAPADDTWDCFLPRGAGTPLRMSPAATIGAGM
jgi:hypothetical protein